MDFSTWLDRTTRGDSMRQIAEVADISDRTLSRQLRESDPKPDIIIKIAEAYDESPVIALVDLGFMSAKWITSSGVATALSKASDEELTDELLRRLQLLDARPVDELAEQRRSKESRKSDQPVRPLGYVADDSDAEPEMGDEGYHDGP